MQNHFIHFSFRRRDRTQGYYLSALFILSSILISLDAYHQAAPVHRILGTLLAPFQHWVDTSVRSSIFLGHYIENQYLLSQENTRLYNQQLILNSQIQRLQALENENKQLHQLLKSTQPFDSYQRRLANLLAVNISPLSNTVILDKGWQAGIRVGQCLLDTTGIVGQVIEAESLTSRVLLVTDPRSAVPVENIRSGIRGLAIGNGKTMTLTLTPVYGSADIQPNDLFLSSGLGGRYPAGYPLGHVSTIHQDPATQKIEVELIPSAHLEHTHSVVAIEVKNPAVLNTQSSSMITSAPVKQ